MQLLQLINDGDFFPRFQICTRQFSTHFDILIREKLFILFEKRLRRPKKEVSIIDLKNPGFPYY